MSKVIDFEGVKLECPLSSSDKKPDHKNSYLVQEPKNFNDILLIENHWFYNKHKKELSDFNGTQIKLREKTACVLNLLIERKFETVASSDFFKHIWSGRHVSENVLKQSIKELRNCFNDKDKSLIKTNPKIGYSLHANVTIKSNDHLESEIQDEIDTPSSCEKPSGDNITRALDNSNRQSKPEIEIQFKRSSPRFQPQSTLWQVNRSILALALITCLAIFSTYQYFQASEQLKASILKTAEVQSQKKFYQDILVRYHDTPKPTSNTLKTILKKSINQIDAFKGSDVEKVGMLNALMELYTISGFYRESRVIASRIEKLVEPVYGAHSEEYARLRFNLIDILIKLNKRQEALSLSQVALKQVQEFHSSNSYLLARAFYYSGKSHLYCVAPFCDRSESLSMGEKQTRKALKIFEDNLDPNSIEIADTLWLLNWFIWDGEEKIRISEKVLNIYQHTHGLLHEKTADGLEQLGRTLTFWNQDWKTGEQMLFQALDIRKSLYPDVHPEMAKINSYIGEHYFMTGQFDLAIQYLNSAIDINTFSIGEGNDQNLENIMLVARSQLYIGNLERANQLINSAFDIVERHKLTPSEIIFDAILITQMRINLAMDKSMSLQNIKQYISSVQDKYKSPSYVLLHEYQTQILRYFPSSLNDSYLLNIERIKNGLTPTNRYLYRSDFVYLSKRALELCARTNTPVCSKLQKSITIN